MNAPVLPPDIRNRKRYHAFVRAAFTRWHRRMGLLAAAFVLLLSVTGILLSHAEYFGLHKKRLPDVAADLFYADEAPHLLGVQLNSGWIVWRDGQLYLNGQPVGHPLPGFQGAVDTGHMLAVAGRNEMLLLTTDGQFFEKLNGANLPGPVYRLAPAPEGRVLMESEGGLYISDSDLVTWQAAATTGEDVTWSAPTSALPQDVRQQVIDQHAGVSVLRFVADLHSGRFMGRFGPLVMDLAAIVLLLLAGSGFYLWWRQRTARPKRAPIPPKHPTAL